MNCILQIKVRDHGGKVVRVVIRVVAVAYLRRAAVTAAIMG